MRENGSSHAHSNKKSKFFFEIFRMENFTLRIFLVHREVNRATFDLWGRNTTQTSVEGLQDGLPHKSEGERDILQAFQQSLCSLKSTQNGCCSICLPKNKKSPESDNSESKKKKLKNFFDSELPLSVYF